MAGRRPSSPIGVVGGGLLVLALAGPGATTSCGPNRDPGECSGKPAFVLTVSAEDGALPSNLEIEVRYGGSQTPETYRLAGPHEPEVVFCFLPADTGGDGGAAGRAGAPDSVTCRLWTEGPANVTVRGEGYPPARVDLRTDGELCTVNESIELARAEGGSGS